jgi:hypothetical protein
MTCKGILKKLLSTLDYALRDNNIDENWRENNYACFMDEEEAYMKVRETVLDAEKRLKEEVKK